MKLINNVNVFFHRYVLTKKFQLQSKHKKAKAKNSENVGNNF